MRALWTKRGNWLTLEFGLDPGEVVYGLGQMDAPIELAVNEASFAFDASIPLPHPDLLAVAATVVLGPWIGDRLLLNTAVSSTLGDVLLAEFGITVSPVDRRLPAREVGTHIGLSFGGGQDSAAVARLLPHTSPLIHLRRVDHSILPAKPTPFRPDVLAAYSERFADLGFDVHIVDSDVEHLCLPHPTFPTWPAITTASILRADSLDLGSIATGTVLGARYFLTGHTMYAAPHPDLPWERLFAAAGVPLMMPLAGATESTTGRIVEDAGWLDRVRSCPLGALDEPCWNCSKCLRKELVNAARAGREPEERLMDAVLREESHVLRPLERPPPYDTHHMFEYAFSRLPQLRATPLKRAMDSMRLNVEETRWVERYWPGSIYRDVPGQWRTGMRPRISAHTTNMDDSDQANFLKWDAMTRTTSPSVT